MMLIFKIDTQNKHTSTQKKRYSCWAMTDERLAVCLLFHPQNNEHAVQQRHGHGCDTK